VGQPFKLLSQLPQGQPFKLPHGWGVGEQTMDCILGRLQWYAWGCTLPAPVWDEWKKTAAVISVMCIRGQAHTIHAYPINLLPCDMAYVDIGNDGIFKTSACSSEYCMRDVTGADLSVQRTLLMQENTAKAVKEAVICVFTYNLQELAFVCQGGTHRSLAVAFLLAVLAYPAAEICVHTTRTIEAMRKICTP